KNIELNLTEYLRKENCFVYTDIAKLKQILNNLISNAVKFTRIGKVEFGCLLKKNAIEFFVKDSGIGIHKDMHEQIFERFRQVEVDTTRDFGGLGLGLSISKEYVEMLGGKIWLKSKLNEGAEFYFNIPLISDENAIDDKKQTIAVENDNFEFKTILIAEDNELNFVYLEELLSITKAKIIRAKNGLEAIELCRTNKNIDLVLMDIKMPLLNGFEATKQIKKFRPDLHIIAQTAYAFADDKLKTIESGCNDYIAKPIIEKDFFEIINKFLK
ncbi:MAG: response regulator, partial [Bacteroidales bacterium]|nr:response regulator [Bacteroidales bacterium]